MTLPDPNLHWDGQQWLRWDGAVWRNPTGEQSHGTVAVQPQLQPAQPLLYGAVAPYSTAPQPQYPVQIAQHVVTAPYYGPRTDQSDKGGEAAIAWILTALTLGYFLPWAIAATRGKSNSGSVGLLNFLLGWTFVGWVIALVMACGAHQMVHAGPSVVVVHTPGHHWLSDVLQTWSR